MIIAVNPIGVPADGAAQVEDRQECEARAEQCGPTNVPGERAVGGVATVRSPRRRGAQSRRPDARRRRSMRPAVAWPTRGSVSSVGRIQLPPAGGSPARSPTVRFSMLEENSSHDSVGAVATKNCGGDEQRSPDRRSVAHVRRSVKSSREDCHPERTREGSVSLVQGQILRGVPFRMTS
jgi:hypothetical protein